MSVFSQMTGKADIAPGTKVVDIAPTAAEEIIRLLAKDEDPNKGLRLGVKGGGCSGLSYVIDFDQKKPGDMVFKEEGFQVFIDPKSSLYLQGSKLVFTGGLQDSGFKFENPNASNTCGCGESFAI